MVSKKGCLYQAVEGVSLDPPVEGSEASEAVSFLGGPREPSLEGRADTVEDMLNNEFLDDLKAMG